MGKGLREPRWKHLAFPSLTLGPGQTTSDRWSLQFPGLFIQIHFSCMYFSECFCLTQLLVLKSGMKTEASQNHWWMQPSRETEGNSELFRAEKMNWNLYSEFRCHAEDREKNKIGMLILIHFPLHKCFTMYVNNIWMHFHISCTYESYQRSLGFLFFFYCAHQIWTSELI